jgi:predicted nucleic acid-binding protein
MSYLFDTNIFLRLTNKADPAHSLALEALRTLRRRREMLCITPLVLAEFGG